MPSDGKKPNQKSEVWRKKERKEEFTVDESESLHDDSDEDTSNEAREEGLSAGEAQADFAQMRRTDFDCNDAPGGWSDKKRLYCCEKMKVRRGCPKTTWNEEDLDDELIYRESIDAGKGITNQVDDLDGVIKQSNTKARHAKDESRMYAEKLQTLMKVSRKSSESDVAKQ